MNMPAPTERQARIIWASLTALAVAVILGLIGFFVWALGLVFQQLSTVLLPLAIAGVIAYLLDPVVDFLEMRGLPRARAIICVFALAALTVAGVVASVLPQIIEETHQLAERVPAYAIRLQLRIQYWVTHPPAHIRNLLNLPPPPPPPPLSTNEATELEPTDTTVTNAPATNAPAAEEPIWNKALNPKALRSATSWIAQALPKLGSWVVSQLSRVASWFGILAGLFLIPVYAFYLLLEKRGIARNWSDYLPVSDSRAKQEMIFVLSSINDCLISFFRGQVLVALCDGVLYTIGFFSIGLPYAFLLGALAIFLTMIPFLGAMITCVAALIIALVQFTDWLHPALVMVVFGVVQLLEGLVISPRIMGGRVGMHPLTIIIAVMVGTALMGGILGGLLAIPLTAALRAVMFRYVWTKRTLTTAPGLQAPAGTRES